MKDTASKVAFLAVYIEAVSTIAKKIANDHVARVYARALFLAIDSFTKLAPALKNTLVTDKVLTRAEGDAVKEKIKKLTADYESYYAQLRDKTGAHQQEVDLDRLIEIWNETDTATLTIFADGVAEVIALFGKAGLSTLHARPAELNDEKFLTALAQIGSEGSPATMGVDRVAITRPQTLGMISCHPTQEKAQRVIAAFDNIEVIRTRLPKFTSRVPHKIFIDLLVVDLCSILDNLFKDDPGDANRAADPSLVTLWKAENMRGVSTLEAFPRDVQLEDHLRTIRNRASAHVDTQMTLEDILSLVRAFRDRDTYDYLTSLNRTFCAACSQDMRTRILLIHGVALQGLVGVVPTDAIKSFRT